MSGKSIVKRPVSEPWRAFYRTTDAGGQGTVAGGITRREQSLADAGSKERSTDDVGTTEIMSGYRPHS